MRTPGTHGTSEDVISNSDSQTISIARRLRELIADVYPDVVKVPWPKQQIVGYGIGPKN